ncbi:MAG TPA: acyltransferase, partial [Gemmatimonadaceae bacterium]|nr:acyltransferase [Gemmatimonadaceae bacterium]
GRIGRVIARLWKRVCFAVYLAARHLPWFRFVRETEESQNPRTFRIWFFQKVLGFNRGAYWPVHFTSKVNQWQNILVGCDTSPGYEPGCYIQGLGRVTIGDYTEIAQNVGIISANHDVYDHRMHDLAAGVRIGSYCWIGMGAVVLPGVELGDFTVVGAGSVVTRSFPEGYVVIAGNPARVIRTLEPEKCVRYRYKHEYRGYIPAREFARWKEYRLWL